MTRPGTRAGQVIEWRGVTFPSKTSCSIRGLHVGLSCHWANATLVAGMELSSAVDLELNSNGRIPYCRTHLPDPLLPVEPLEIQRQVSEWSCRPVQLLTDSTLGRSGH
jgi:hypothetical protein